MLKDIDNGISFLIENKISEFNGGEADLLFACYTGSPKK